MGKYERLFFCDKSIVLNAIYDALDAIGFTIDSANSGRGVLIVSGMSPPLSGRIAISSLLAGDRTSVEVFPQENDQNQTEWISAFFDEAESLIRKAGMMK